MDTRCPSCLTPYSPGPLTTPHILPCTHTHCSGCIQHTQLLSCAVSSCQAALPRQTLDMFPVNYYVVGKVVMEQNIIKDAKVLDRESVDVEKDEELAESRQVNSCQSIYKKQVLPGESEKGIFLRSESNGTLLKARAFLKKLDVIEKQLERSSEETKAELENHIESSHSQLELLGSRMKGILREKQTEKVMKVSDVLCDGMEKSDDCLISVEVKIDGSIFNALEHSLKIDVSCLNIGTDLFENVVVNDKHNNLEQDVSIGGDDDNASLNTGTELFENAVVNEKHDLEQDISELNSDPVDHNINQFLAPPVADKTKTSTNWPSPRRPSVQFQAVASHVDWEGRIYLIPVADFENLRIIKKVLDSKYKDSSPGAGDKNWASGESVIVRWDKDGRWYRGVVMEVNCEDCLVQFVDYGTVEVCPVENMRKEVFMATTPIQCISLELEDVQPNSEKWDDSILDLLHEIVVDQTFSVTITETHEVAEQEAPYLGKLKTKAGIDIGQVLVNNGFAIARSSITQM